MKKKYKLTAFSKFIMFLVVAIPLAIGGSSLIFNENAFEVIGKKLKLDKIKEMVYKKPAAKNATIKIEDCGEKIEKLEDRIDSLEKELKQTTATIKQLKIKNSEKANL